MGATGVLGSRWGGKAVAVLLYCHQGGSATLRPPREHGKGALHPLMAAPLCHVALRYKCKENNSHMQYFNNLCNDVALHMATTKITKMKMQGQLATTKITNGKKPSQM